MQGHERPRRRLHVQVPRRLPRVHQGVEQAYSQLRLNDQIFLDLFMGGIYKLGKPNEDCQQSSKPSAKPRLSGVFRQGGSLVSPTVLECIEIGLIKLTVELQLRNRTIFKDVPILFATYEDVPRSSPSPDSGRDGRHSRGQLMINMPLPNASVVNGTELQLGGPRSALQRSGEAHQSPSRAEQFARDSFESVRTRPPPPRLENVLPQNDLTSGKESKAQGLVPLFKAEPLLNGKCPGLYLRRGGCTYGNCSFCKKSLRDAPHVDSGDLERALRRACATANAREQPGTPGRGRSDSVGSASSVGSQNSTGGGHKPKKGRH